jgi:hypothetical protein
MKGAKIGVIFLVAIMSVAGVGASYAAWTKSVDIYTAATTGYIDFTIEQINVVDADGAVITPVQYDTHTWGVTITNTYPGWKGFVNILERNTGTIPLKFNTFQVLSLAGPSELQNAYTLSFYPPGSTTPNIAGTLWTFTDLQYYEGSGSGHWGVPPGAITLAPGIGQWSLISLELPSTLTGNENTPVTFTFEMTAIQA